MCRIVIMIFYSVGFVWSFLGFILPAVPFVKVCLGFWITLPQCKGEFFFYHLFEEYILKAERVLLAYRCTIFSTLVSVFNVLQIGCVKLAITYISEECIVKSQEICQQVLDMLQEEIQCRCENGGAPIVKEVDDPKPREPIENFFNPDDAKTDPRKQFRDSYIRTNESSARMKMNQTMDQAQIEKVIQPLNTNKKPKNS